MADEKIFLASPHMSDEGYEMEYINEAFKTNWIAPLGTNVDGFEKDICTLTEAKGALALSSGTAAIHLALKSAGIKAGDIVLCQSLTFSASVNPVAYEKAVPVFVDSDEDTWNMSPEALKKAFDKYPNAKIVIAVHLYGMSAEMDDIKDICKAHGAVLIEDAAESLGTVYKGRYTGSIGDYGIFSFNGNKIITTSGGGMLLSNTEDARERIEKAKFWSTQARDNARYYQHSEIGYNYRMSNILAGIGRGQMKILDKRIEQKRTIYNRYKERFADVKDIKMMPVHDEFERCNCWLSCLQLAEGSAVKPMGMIKTLEKENIEARPVWKPMHLQPVFADCDYIDNGGVAEKLFDNGVCMPSDTKMTGADIERICDIVLDLWK